MNKALAIEMYLNGANIKKCCATNEIERVKWEAYEKGILKTLDLIGWDYEYDPLEGMFHVEEDEWVDPES